MNNYNFNDRVDRKNTGSLKESLTPDNIRQAGLVSYWGAEFEFPVCPAFSKGVITCAERGSFAFTIQDKQYNERVAWWMANVRNFEIQPEWIVPAMGTIFGLATAIRMFVGKNENIIILQPTYGRYKQAADRMNIGTVISRLIYHGQEDFSGSAKEKNSSVYEIDWNDLEEKMSKPSNRLLVICNPNNPTGTILNEEELRKIAELSKKYNVLVFCDEIFAEITLEDEKAVPYSKIAGEDALAITSTSMGKCMSITGYNHANLIIRNPELREQYNKQKYADHFGSIEPTLYAGMCEAYTEDGKEYVEQLNAVIRENAALFEETFERYLKKAKVIHPKATYVIWVDYSGLLMSDEQLSDFLREKALLFGDDGEEYGASKQFYRYSIAVPKRELEKSMQYLKDAAAKENAEHIV